MADQRPFEELGLRAQKRARTTVSLLDALVEALATHTLDEIQISDLARTAGVSEPTFYNYFPNKSALLTYFVRAWGIRMGAAARQIASEHGRSLAAIEAVFVATADEIADGPNIMLEIIAAQARGFEPPTTPIERPVRLLLVPDTSDVMDLSEEGLAGVVPRLLQSAIDDGELPAETDRDRIWLAVASVFFGVPLLVGRHQPHLIRDLYLSQLQLLWAGCQLPDHA